MPTYIFLRTYFESVFTKMLAIQKTRSINLEFPEMSQINQIQRIKNDKFQKFQNI